MINYQLQLKQIKENNSIIKLNDDAIGFSLAEFIKNSNKKYFLHVTECDKRLEELKSQIEFFAPEVKVLTFPAWDSLPYDRASPKNSIIATRIKTLIEISQNRDQKTLIITTVNSVLQKITPKDQIIDLGFEIKKGDSVPTDKMVKFLDNNGYKRMGTANDIGEFAVRGNIIDVVIYSKLQRSDDLIGYRFDFFGNEIDEIRIFDPITQITSNSIKKVNFFPASEIILNEQSINNFKKNYQKLFGYPDSDQLYDHVVEAREYVGMENFLPLFYESNLESLFSYLDPKDSFICLEDKIFTEITARSRQIEEYYQSRIDTIDESRKNGNIYNPLLPDKLYINEEEFKKSIENFLVCKFHNFSNSNLNERSIDLGIKSIPNFLEASKSNKKYVFELFSEFLRKELIGKKIIINTRSEGSRSVIGKILHQNDFLIKEVNQFSEIKNLKKNEIGIAIFDQRSGFYSSDLAIISENVLLGEKIKRKNKQRLSKRILEEGFALKQKDLVVHIQHGIGRFEGLETMKIGRNQNDFLKITYKNNDNLFVPVEDIDLITKYSSENSLIELDILGGANWKNRCKKAKEKIKIIAAKLINLAAKRKMQTAPIMDVESGFYDEFKNDFPFIETIDQLKAVEEIEEDLIKGCPMDRLICGDVGFGKTEVAMRAAFIAASSGYQVTIITPTTLLCRQHYNNFLSRFSNSKFKIASLYRMNTAAKNREVRAGMEDGSVNIVIGTHAILAKNTKFKNLGLVILDEEQHFGVSQKERIKEFKNEIHILSLSATPIPRTMQMSLSGIKEMSIIATPPIDRMAIRNFVMPYDSVITKEALMREYQRGGKSFFVVPRISDLRQIEKHLKDLVPEIKIRSAHGQMKPDELDEIMNDFYDNKFDILLSTTIIESGIDIAGTNTIIIYKAENFGLAQLYQLRGRVGRGKIRAYSYLMSSAGRKLTKNSVKKLEVMQNIDSLGAGFSIASHDMDIRGAGNIVGDEQSGHIRDTGIELYQSMLKEEVENISNEEIKTLDTYQVKIKLGLSLLIPEKYISDIDLRMSLYKRIGNITIMEEKQEMEMELTDRFGKIPEEVNNLLEISHLKILAKEISITKIESRNGDILIEFKNNKFADVDSLLKMVFASKGKIKLDGERVLFINHKKKPKLDLAIESINKLTLL
jgi:transcription-repair coupling factor (superfamily II helicase)